MSDRTTINVTKDAHQSAKEAKKDGESWSEYIQRCIGESQYPNPQPMQNDLEAIKEQLDTIESAQANTVSAALEAAEDADASTLTYDDVVQANKKALRDELPDQVFR